MEHLLTALDSYLFWARQEFGKSHDHFRLVGQDNIRRYQAVREIRVRVHAADTCFEIFARVCAARSVGCRITVSTPPQYASLAVDVMESLTDSWAGAIEFVEESDV